MAESENQDDPTDENIRQLLAHFHHSEQARLEKAKSKLRAEILPALAQHWVANVEAAYSGYGDSGAIDVPQFRDTTGQRVDRATIPSPVLEQLENCIYELLPAGFEINDGGQGTVLIETQTGKVALSTGSRTSCRRRGSTGTATTASLPHITSSGVP